MERPYQSIEVLGGGAYADVHRIADDRVLKIARRTTRDKAGVTGGVFFANGLAFGTGSVGVFHPDPNDVLEHEITTLRRLDHPVFPAVLEEGTAESRYYVMPHCPGRNWRTAIYQDQAVTIEHVARVVRALAEVRSALPLHGDIKPENLILGDDDSIHILDPSAGSNEIGPGGAPLQLLLTEWYNPALEISDLPALGLLIAEALTGQHMWLAADDDRPQRILGPDLQAWIRLREITGGAKLLRRIASVPLPSELDPAFDSELERIVLRCLSLEYNGERLERVSPYQSVDELARALQR